MALINETFFTYPIYLAMNDDTDVLLINQIISAKESAYLSLITYDAEDEDVLADIKNMIGYFSFSSYIEEQLRLNTGVGTMNLQTDSSVKVSNLDNAYERYNNAVDLFNTYVTDSDDEIGKDGKGKYKNTLGI